VQHAKRCEDWLTIFKAKRCHPALLPTYKPIGD
jgi:hypothetical protein